MVMVIAMMVMKMEMEMEMMEVLQRFLLRLRHLRSEIAMLLRCRIRIEGPGGPKVEAYAFD
jgi:hypothetical protein